MPLDSWDIDEDRRRRFDAFERAFWLVGARVLIPANALIIGYLIGQVI